MRLDNDLGSELIQLAQRRTRTFGQLVLMIHRPIVDELREYASKMHAEGHLVFQVKVCIQCGARVIADTNGVPIAPMPCGH